MQRPSKTTWSQQNKPNGTTNYHEVPMIVIESPESSINAQIPYADDDDPESEEDEKEEEVLSLKQDIAKRLRRNSISFPSELNQIQLDNLRQTYEQNKVSKFIFLFKKNLMSNLT